MKKTILILMAGLLLISLNVIADDVLIDSDGNVSTGVSSGGNLTVIGGSGEYGIVGVTSGTGAVGVYGENTSDNYGNLGGDNYGVFGYSLGGWAGYFLGDVHITGDLTVGGTFNVTETDPQVGTLVDGQWCTSDGTQVNCDQSPPLITETDPTVNALGKAVLSCGSSQVPKWDGANWVCAEDSDTAYSAGTGLDLSGNTFSLNVPLALSGAVAYQGIISGTNSSVNGAGGFFEATGDGYGVYGQSYSSGDGGLYRENYGGRFEAIDSVGSGNNLYGVYGSAYVNDVALTGANIIGGRFSAVDSGSANLNAMFGIYGTAYSEGNGFIYGGYFEANGDNSLGVYSFGSSYGGYFISTGSNGYGVMGYASGSGVGVFGSSESGLAGYFDGNTLVTGDLTVVGLLTAPGIGDITTVSAGTGLSGGGTNGDVSLTADTSYLQRRVTGNCNGQVMVSINEDGTVTCETDDGITAEADPTVAASVKDGVDWTELTGIPAGFADGVDNTGTYSAGTGLTLDGLTFNIQVPLSLSGSTTGGTLSGENSQLSGSGVYGSSSGSAGRGVYGVASAAGAVTNYGGIFQAFGDFGRGVYGYAAGSTGRGVHGAAAATGSVTNYGGYFEAYGNSGRGVHGAAAATGSVTNYGGYFEASGNSGRGVYGFASATGPVFNYGGYFQASGDYSRGVYGLSSGSAGYGVYGLAANTGAVTNYGGYFDASGDSGRGVYGVASATGSVTNYGGYFQAWGDSGIGVYGLASQSGSAVTNYGGYFRAFGSNSRGVYGNGAAVGVYGSGGVYDFYAAGAGANYGPFTGGHEVILSKDFPESIKTGMIVSVTGKARIRKDEDNNISISSTLPTVRLSDKPRDKAVFGAFVKESSLPEDHWYKKKEGEKFGIVNALGEGRVWITNLNGNISAGDYITTSSIPGYGQRQEDDLLHSYTLGKVIEDVDWGSVTETIVFNGQIVKIYLIAVVYTSG